MADTDPSVLVSLSTPGEVMLPPTPALQNSLKCSNTGKFVSILCDFGTVQILKLKVSSDGTVSAETVKKLTFGKAETLVGHSWTTCDDVFAVAGQKVYLLEVSQDFALIHTFELYFHPNDVSITTLHKQGGDGKLHALHQVAIAGPNGVEINNLRKIGSAFSVAELVPLHADLAISLVLFSPDGQYLAVAALDCHFGIWNVSSLSTDKKKFWYVLLDTVKITGVAFSPDSNMVAVSCWDASVHLYQKARDSNSFTWMEVQLNTNRKLSKTSEAMPGTFVCWSADSQMFMQSLWSDIGCSVSTISVYSRRECHHQDFALSAEDAIKGIDSCRLQSGSTDILCFTRTKLLLLKWPGDIKCSTTSGSLATTDCQPTEEILGDYSEPTRSLLGTYSVLTRSLLGSVWLVAGTEQNVVLRWAPSAGKVRERLEAFENTAFSRPGQGSPTSTSPEKGKAVGQDVEIDAVYDKLVTDGREELEDGVSEISKSQCLEEKAPVLVTGSVYCDCWAGQTVDNSKPAGSQSIIGNCAEDCQAHHDETQTATEFPDKRSVRVTEPSERENSGLLNSERDGEKRLTELFPHSTATERPFSRCEFEEAHTSDQNVTSADRAAEADQEAALLASDKNGLAAKVTDEILPCKSCSKCGKTLPEQSSPDHGAFIDVKASFLSAISDESPSVKRRPFSKSLFESGEAEVLVSDEYLVVVVYPLLAHVYCHTARTWRVLVFCTPVVCCCLVAGRYLFVLKRDGIAELRALELMDLLASSTLKLKYVEKERPLMVGATFHAAVTLFDVDSAGRGEVLHVTFDKTGGTSITVHKHLVYFPFLSRENSTLYSAHMLGHIVLIRPRPKRRLPRAVGLGPSQDTVEAAGMSTWTALVPALNLAQNIPVDPDCSVEQIFLEKYQGFYKLEALSHTL